MFANHEGNMHKTKNEKASFTHGGAILFMKSTYIVSLLSS